jgi:transposase-like protein
MSLKFMEQMPLKPELMTCPNCGEEKRIGIHSHQEQRYICHARQRLAKRKGRCCTVRTTPSGSSSWF